ncbi:hypothetical protein BS78_07G194700 [Paspalum vaginatum]|nr:hypothetical protein BS78_07G194700 [Paspalum vaginatum]
MPTASMLGSGFTEFKLDLAANENLAVGDFVLSDEIPAGGHVWRVRCYPRGDNKANNGAYLSVFLGLVSNAKNVSAIFEAFLLCRDGAPSSLRTRRCVQVYPPEGSDSWGFPQLAKWSDLASSDYAGDDGLVTFVFGVIVQRGSGSPITVPRSDIGRHLGRLLDDADGSDVTFSVAGEEFAAHRAVLAARSPVFRAQLFGAMADASMSCIALQDIHPATFRALLRFVYTDALPGDEELLESSAASAAIVDLLQDLLAAADMYQLDRLKLVCAQKLWERVSAETVATVLGCAEMHNCPELKDICLDFFVEEKNFKVAVLTEGYLRLMQSFPSIIDEIRARV